MPRGGEREGAGAKLKWKHGKTKQIRVPEALADKVLELTETLDNGYEVGRLDILDNSTDPKVINLAGLSIYKIKGELRVALKDLVNKGYQILPDNLANKVIDEIYTNQLDQANKKL